jgi:hypothetical protein
MPVVASRLTGNEVSASIRLEVTPETSESGCAIFKSLLWLCRKLDKTS